MQHIRLSIMLLLCWSRLLNADWPSVDASATRHLYKEDIQKNNHTMSHAIGCVFCNELDENNDEQRYILKRYKHVYVELNPYPYRQGHMLVLPVRHVAKLQDLTMDELEELIKVIAMAMRYLNEVYTTDGINTGINEGRAAGASKPDHLHVQIVPRWIGDTGWFNIIGQTGIISESMSTTYQRLKAKFDQA